MVNILVPEILRNRSGAYLYSAGHRQPAKVRNKIPEVIGEINYAPFFHMFQQ